MLEWRGKSILDVDSILSLTQRWQIFEGMEVSWPGSVLLPSCFYPIFDIQISTHENDGVKLSEALCSSETPEDVRDIFASIEGP